MTAVPSAQGSLQQTPLLHLLVYALDRKLTGTLVLEDPERRKHALYFDAGVPVKVRPAEPIQRLGDLLLELGYCSEQAVKQALERALAEKKLFGEVLVADGALERETLLEALSEQVSRSITTLGALPPETAFGYYEGINYLQRWGGTDSAPVAPLALIWRVAREHADPLQVAHFLGRIGDGVLRLHVEAPVNKLGLDSRTQSAIDVLRAKPQPLSELLGRELLDLDTARRLLYTLLLVRYIELPGAGTPIGIEPIAPRATISPRPASVTPQAASAPAARARPAAAPSPESEALRKEIQRRAEESGQTYYELLGVPPEATVTTIQGAFFQLAKAWHPDRLPAELADVRELAARVFSRMSEAHQVLSDPERRKEYDAKTADGGQDAEEQEQVQRVLRAHTSYQKALVLMKKHSMEAAENEARRAAEDDPEQADYVGLVAWLEAMKPGARLDLLIADLDRAVHMEENNLRVRWFRGQLLKRIGRENRALADFRYIFERDPRHVDAQREIRLYEMRRGSSRKSDPPPKRPSDPPAAGSEKSGGVFGRFFKKP
jgi:curved DNA-binding protein CbpA